MAKAKNEADFTVLRVHRKTLPKLRKLNALIIQASGERESIYVTVDDLISKELKNRVAKKI